jgi:hypothetical protein
VTIDPAGTLYAALYGELSPHPWRGATPDSDAYRLFVARSAAMGWLAEPREGAAGVWGMNDAGHVAASEPPPARPVRVAWFQASLAGGLPRDRPLPVQPFLRCAGDVVARLGTVRLHRVQVLLPVQCLPSATSPGGAVTALLQDAGWFGDADPRRRTVVRVTLHGGEGAPVSSAAPELTDWLRRFHQDVFGHPEVAPEGDDEPPPDVTDALWGGPVRHQLKLTGTLVEWSLDAVGWLAAFVAEAAARHGVAAPLFLTVDRPE